MGLRARHRLADDDGPGNGVWNAANIEGAWFLRREDLAIFPMVHHSRSEETNVPVLFPSGPQARAGRTSRGVVTALAVAFRLLAAGIFIFLATREKTGSALYGLVSDTDERRVIKGDLEAVNQSGVKVRLSDLRGKVWAIAEFFAVCPICSRRNSTDLRALAKRFSEYPDFHLVCLL